MNMRAKLVLEDGKVFEGYSFAAEGEACAEVVFNTSMSGYQEVLTDPSYKGQIVAMTYPLIGNYGVNSEDVESSKTHLSGFIVKEYSRIKSSWRADKTLPAYLKENNIIGIEGIDTRSLTRHIRLKGAMKAVISTKDLDNSSLMRKAKTSLGLVGRDLVKEVSCKKSYEAVDIISTKTHNNTMKKVIAIDFGIKYNILRCLINSGCSVKVVPATTTAEEILNENPDGVFLSNGPGDPAPLSYAIETVKNLLGKIPIFGICLGHQIIGLAFDGASYKLRFGHHGANHPVKDLASGKISITSQNHGFCIDADSLKNKDITTTHINLNDNTLEGFENKDMKVFCVQFHPESAPGPHDAQYLFDKFIKLMEK